MKQILVAILVVAGLVGCASGLTTKELERKVIGKSKNDLLNCMGTPSDSHSAGTMEYMTYRHRDTKKKELHKCDADFILANDRVTKMEVAGGEEGGNEVTSDFCRNLIIRCFK